MMARATAWYSALTQRERGLVAVALGLVAAVVLVFGVVLPLGAAHDAAHLRHSAATQASARLLAQLALLEAPAPPRNNMAGPLMQVVAASADTAGFVLQSNQPRGNDATLVILPTARPSAALAWLDGLAVQGIVLENLTMTPAADGSVAVNATLKRAQ